MALPLPEPDYGALFSIVPDESASQHGTVKLCLAESRARAVLYVLLLPLGLLSPLPTFAGDRCADASREIQVDRPDVTNSSLVVPTGSVQIENGVNVTDRREATIFDGTNSRLRLSIGHCSEVLFDAPNYVRPSGLARSGFSDLTPAIKHQLGPLPGDFDLSATVGVALPTGTKEIAGNGYQPYLQFP